VAELVFAHLFTGCRFLQDSNRKMPVSGQTEFAKLKKSYEKGFLLKDGDLCIMGKDSQIKYQHGLKSEISSEVICERISITFREFK
jgi:hypothetical protein